MTPNPCRSTILPRLWRASLGGLLVVSAAAAQPAPATKDGVIKPPSRVDPGMQVKPKAQPALPMPVVKPPATVVPK